MSPEPPDGSGNAERTADTVAAAVLGVPGVSDLHAGVLGEVATYLPGRRVNGLKLRDDGSEIHIVTEWDAPVVPTADAVRAAVEGLVTGPVVVVVEDVAAPDDTPSTKEEAS